MTPPTKKTTTAEWRRDIFHGWKMSVHVTSLIFILITGKSYSQKHARSKEQDMPIDKDDADHSTEATKILRAK